MTARGSLTIVVPVYNEGANIRRWWEAARPHLPPGARVVVVYDFEEDDTLPSVRALHAEGAPFQLLRNRSRGVLNAIVTGLRSAPSGPVLVSMADLSDDFGTLPAMLEAHRGGASVVVASRYMPGGEQVGGPWLKGHLARWGGRSLRWLAGFPVHDATNNYRLYDADLVRSISIESTGGFEVGFEITLKAWMLGARVAEVPTTWNDRTGGQSRFDLKAWLPRYARLWRQALAYGLRLRLGLAPPRQTSAPHALRQETDGLIAGPPPPPRGGNPGPRPSPGRSARGSPSALRRS